MESRTRYGLAKIRWLLWNFLYLCVVGPGVGESVSEEEALKVAEPIGLFGRMLLTHYRTQFRNQDP